MHYIDEGRGEPIVFVHGNPTWSFEFRHLILGLKDSYRCIAMDHIGFGLSSCSDSDKDYHPRAQATPFERSANAALPGYIIGASDWLGELWAENRQFIDNPPSCSGASKISPSGAENTTRGANTSPGRSPMSSPVAVT